MFLNLFLYFSKNFNKNYSFLKNIIYIIKTICNNKKITYYKYFNFF